MYLDTHAVVWLYEGNLNRFSTRAKKLLNSESLLISPIVLLELQYLYEISRVRYPSRDVLLKLRTEIGLEVCSLPFADVIASANFESWTRDTFDRIVVAQAKAAGMADLLSFDSRIQENYARAFS